MAAEDASATFRLALEDATSGPAASSAAALDSLQQKMLGDVAALKQLQTALRNLKGGGVAADSAVKGLKDQIAAKKATIAGSQAGLLQFGAGLGKAKTSAHGAAEGIAGLGEKLQSAKGPLGSFAKSVGELAPMLFSLPGLLVLVAAAFVAVTAATALAVKSLLEYGIATADARRNELLRLEGLTKIRNFWSGFNQTQGNAAQKAAFLQQNIDSVSASVAIGRDQVAGYAEQLYKMGLRGGNLQAALQGVATTAAVQGDAQAQAFAQWAAGANLTGQSVKALAADVKARLGGIAAVQLLSLDVQSKKLHESFAMLFSGLKLDKFLEGVSSVTALFSQSTASGRALKVIVEALFQPLIDGAGKGAPLIKRFFQGMVIGALLITIAILTLKKKFESVFGKDLASKIDLGTVAVYAGVGAFLALAAAVTVTALAIGFLLLPFILLGAAVVAVGALVGKLVVWWQGVDWSALGNSIIDGIVNGVKNGATKIWNAVKGIALTASKAFTTTLGIASPSKVFEVHGYDTARGSVVGLNRGAGAARTASHRMAREIAEAGDPVRAGGGVGAGVGVAAFAGARAEAPGTPAAPRGGAPVTITFGDVHVGGGPDAKAQAESFMAQLTDLLQGVGITLGARTAGA